MSDYLIMVGVWLALLVSFERSWQRHKLGGQQALLIWSVYLFAGCTFIFRAPALEAAMNAPFGGLPVGYGFKSLFVLLAVAQYHRVMRRILGDALPSWHKMLFRFIPVAIGGNALLLIIGAVNLLNPQQVYYSMMTLNDLAASLNMALVFIPANLILFRQEQLDPMRMKHIATIVFCLAFAFTGFITQVTGPYTVVTGHVTPIHNAVPLVQIVFVCFVIQVMPHRTLHRLLFFQRRRLLHKIRRLEGQILTMAGRDRPPLTPVNWFNEKQMQTALYVACINILDYSATAGRASVTGDLLHRRIVQATEKDAPYETLIKELGRLA